MKINISLLFVTGGLFFISLAGYQYYQSTTKKTEAMDIALEVVKRAPNATLVESSITVENDEVMGILHLPKLAEKLPIIRGVSEEDLEKGVGFYEGTALPNQNDQIVLSGHRDTVFKRLGELVVGDELIVEMPTGKYSYIIEETFIVDADDRTVIKSTAPVEKLTVTTCYPFNFVGPAPKRYIVNAIRK
jgi:sortase A